MLISEPVQVEMTDSGERLREPKAFVWRGERYEVAQVESMWTDTGFVAGERTRTWYRRRHRNCWRVKTTAGEVYELYLDRGGGRRTWILARRVDE